MWKGRTLARVPVLVGAALFSIHCTDAAGPERQLPRPLAATAGGGSGIQLDQWNGTIGGQANPLMIIKGFNPTNPHVGDAIIATFFWFGTPGGVTGNIIDSVTDVLTTAPYTPVGNKYEFVEFVTHGNVSMATYVATNVQGFPDAGEDVSQILAVKADLKVPVVDPGVLLSAWVGVAGVSTEAIGEHRSASGAGTPQLLTGPTTAAPGAISVNAGALAYGISISSPPAGSDGPAGWTNIATLSDVFMKSDGQYDARFTVSPSGGAADPQWSWFFNEPGSWLATVLALNAAPSTEEPPPPPPPPPESADGFVTGGGKLQDGREYATFGLKADPTGGKIEWVQHCPDGPNPASAVCARGKFKFHGTVTPGSYSQASRGPRCRIWAGTGTSKETGARDFTVQQGCDGGEPGRGVDYIEVTIDDYQNSGYLTGGNIQLHRSKP